MSRIIHVDDSDEWIEVVRRVLADHEVDSATTYEEALALIHGRPAYDLALVDLNLIGEDDRMGGEILDLLRMGFPMTRRVVVTASPPAGDLRINVFERYDVENVIIKGRTTVPDLRMVIGTVLKRRADELPRQVRIIVSELMKRYRDWSDGTGEQIRIYVREAQSRARNSGRAERNVKSAALQYNQWLELQRQFVEECSYLEAVVSSARTRTDAEFGISQLDLVMGKVAAEMSRLLS